MDPANFKVAGKFSFSGLETKQTGADKEELKERLKKLRDEIADLQETMYADGRFAMLICLQGMDTSGKDSLIREVFKEINPRGVTVDSFKVPTELELSHDYLWRHIIALPQRGKIGIFNRTHYENVLVTRVHPEYLLNENIPGIESVDDVTDEFWQKRFGQIVNFEQYLTDNGTVVLKFFLHLSKEEQRQRLLRRLEKQKHNWKFSPGDLKERALWDQYMEYYEQAIKATSTDAAEWHVIPADSKAFARVAVAEAVRDALSRLPMQEPELDEDVRLRIDEYRRMLEGEQ